MTSVLEFVRKDKCIDTTQTLTCDLRKTLSCCLSVHAYDDIFFQLYGIVLSFERKIQLCLDKADITVLYTASS